jgi:tripartite-type tricarboxylate transporter receptor subunit TctC
MVSMATLRLATAGALLLSFPALAAEDPEAFYKGKQIHLIASTDPGGLYDIYGRLFAPFLADHIPGHPTIVVQNMPGAGGLKMVNYIYNTAPKDGTVIGATHSSIPTAPLTSPYEAEFDVNKIGWLGSITSDPYVGYFWNTSPVQSLEEAKTKEAIMGGVNVGSTGVDMAIIGRELLGLKYKIVIGYKSANEVKVAMERGEIHGNAAQGWNSLKVASPQLLSEKKVNVFVQYAFKPHRDLPNVPLFMSLARNDEEKQALTFILARQEAAKPYFVAPGVPADRLAALRKAFDDTVKDPKFLAMADKAAASIDDPMTGQELATLVNKLSQTPRAVVDRVNKIFTDYDSGKK